jgi:hypothetical protein
MTGREVKNQVNKTAQGRMIYAWDRLILNQITLVESLMINEWRKVGSIYTR